ncbi:uncharacterized protein LOC111277077 isoform X1 [Durio zibethinus]|uniref:Uncharacterized protein LOC111277077 isoform X1 n=1 Tax=Durio zibethinus TaxID=66656 RepID=A0A6P5WTZ2_DURZI|nr:uncharacterized protein LOC111277077 isoform X1 [Durio zibethinus]XP_022718961.1 uncharacterized protein LOC111277077 isoform X1 [Durio zibethinus]
MTRGIARSRYEKQRKGEDMKKLKLNMELISKEKRAGKRSYRKQGRKKFPSRESTSPGCRAKVVGKKLHRCQSRLQVVLMQTELAKTKVELSESAESLLAAKIEANQAEAKIELLMTRRNELMDNFLEMKEAEAFLMLKLGFL